MSSCWALTLQWLPGWRSAGRRFDRSEARCADPSYSRSKGLFAGLELKGLVIKPDKDDMRDVYGEGVTAKEVLKENKVTAPAAVRAFPNTLGRYSSRVAKK
jgi:lipid-binding SYLF domain-containing protein